MKIKRFSYKELSDTPREWSVIPFDLHKINLLVGKNATGKTRVLNVINALAESINGRRKQLSDGDWNIEFIDNEYWYNYKLSVSDRNVKEEILLRQELNTSGNRRGGTPKILLERGSDGVGRIRTAPTRRRGSEETLEKFHSSTEQVAIFSRQDKIRHPYFASIIEWASKVRKYDFVGKYSPGEIAFRVQQSPIKFERGEKVSPAEQLRKLMEANSRWKDDIISDINQLGYCIEDVDIHEPENITIKSEFPISGNVEVIYLKERDLNGVTSQINMSPGLFRALMTSIEMNLILSLEDVACILIDDIGEGLDYDRSTNLVKLLISKFQGSDIQMVLTTNDRFVMNSVPIDNWQILDRVGHQVRVINIYNNPDYFEQFEHMGLNNFEFFASEMFRDEQ